MDSLNVTAAQEPSGAITGHSMHDGSASKHCGEYARTSKSRGFCRRLGDCIIMGPANSIATRPAKPIDHGSVSLSKPSCVSQVEEILRKEIEKEKGLNVIYKLKLERSQAFLKFCLQVAQDNGFLHLILNQVDKDQQLCLSSTSPISVFPSPTRRPTDPVGCHPDLVALTDQAKLNGWYIDPREIEMHQLSAQGTTADIYTGRWRGLDVAIKCMYPDYFQLNESGVSFFAQEVETLSRQRNPFILQLIGACLDPPDKCWIVTEFLSMNLKDWIHGSGKRNKERTVPLPALKDRVEKALEIAQAMQYLHESNPKIVHRDLKPSNIFLDDALHVRVADFGHARFLTNGEKALTGETGTFVYMAPEVIRCCPYDEKCDVYSFGIILNELVTGEYPYIETDYGPSKIALEVSENGLRPTIYKAEEEIQERMVELIQQVWDEEPAARPCFREITCNLRSIHCRL